MLSVLTFEPILKERIWGGRNLEKLYSKPLPPNFLIGESWEISDRPGDESVIANGPWRGKTLHDLMSERPADLLGPLKPMPKRFPLLLKIIDARDVLSLQVHPPSHLCEELGGEPKTEMWYVAHAGPAADLFVGLKKGVTRAEFESKLAAGSVSDCFHRIPVKAGDAMFLPSGRVHALGANTIIFEIQQNSDTTYRVFDWNRLDASGKPRQLHVEQSLASIDFGDFEPPLLPVATAPGHPGTIRPLVADKLFDVSLRKMNRGDALALRGGQMHIIAALEGIIRINDRDEAVTLRAGGFALIPACCQRAVVQAESDVAFLQVHLG